MVLWMFSGAGRGPCLLCSSLDLSSHASLVLFPSLAGAPTLRGEQRVLSHLAGWTPEWDGLGFVRGTGFCGSIAAARGRCPCSLQAGAGSSPSSSQPGAAVPWCLAASRGIRGWGARGREWEPGLGQPGAAQRVWAAPRNCSMGLGADVLQQRDFCKQL